MSGWTTWWTPELVVVLIAVVKAIVLLVGLVLLAAMLIWVERRLLALWQDRYGPNRVGPFGLLQVVADMVKIFFKEDWVPPFADKPVFLIAPAVAMITAMLAFVLVPVRRAGAWCPTSTSGCCCSSRWRAWRCMRRLLGGWSSNSKYALLGGLRAAAQMLSYEVFMGIALMGVVIQAGSFQLDHIVAAQQHLWFIVPQFFGFCLFSLAAVATTHRFPVRYAGSRKRTDGGLSHGVRGHEIRHVLRRRVCRGGVGSALLTTLFFGGWHGPFADRLPWLGFVWFALKTFFFIMIFILLKGSLPRPRYDQIMAGGWKVCLPLSLVNTLATAAVVLAGSAKGA